MRGYRKGEGREGVGKGEGEEGMEGGKVKLGERIYPLCNFLDSLMCTRHDDYVCKYNVPASEP